MQALAARRASGCWLQRVQSSPLIGQGSGEASCLGGFAASTVDNMQICALSGSGEVLAGLRACVAPLASRLLH